MDDEKILEEMSRLNRRVSHLSKELKKVKQSRPRVEIVPTQKTRLTSAEAAQFMGISLKGLQKLTAEHRVPFSKPNGKMIYFDPDELTRWMSRNRQEAEYDDEEEVPSEDAD